MPVDVTGHDGIRRHLKSKPVRVQIGSETRTFQRKGWYPQETGSKPKFDPHHKRAFNNAVGAAKRQARPLLAPGQIEAIRRRLGLSQREASALFGGGPRSFQKYEDGSAVPGTAMSRLLFIVDQRPTLAKLLAKYKPSKVSGETS